MSDRVRDALEALALRLWGDDRPEDPTRNSSIDQWAAGLPEDEAAALNGMLGQNYGNGPAWDSDHPASQALREADDG